AAQESGGGTYTLRRYAADGTAGTTSTVDPATGWAYPAAIALDATGNIYVAGGYYAPAEREPHLRVEKPDAAGAVQWTYTRGSSGDDQASGVAVDASGNVFLGGLTKSTIVGTNAAGHDAVVGRLDASGAETWLIQYGNGSN